MSSQRESLKPLPKRPQPFKWQEKAPKGVVSQGDYEASRGKKRSWKLK